MLKIHCPECQKSFIWTDDMPPRGKCPNPDCEGLYDIHESLRQSLAARAPAAAVAFCCPACGAPIPSRWTLCNGCGRIVAGARAFRKRHLLLLSAMVLLFMSLVIRIWIRF